MKNEQLSLLRNTEVQEVKFPRNCVEERKEEPTRRESAAARAAFTGRSRTRIESFSSSCTLRYPPISSVPENAVSTIRIVRRASDEDRGRDGYTGGDNKQQPRRSRIEDDRLLAACLACDFKLVGSGTTELTFTSPLPKRSRSYTTTTTTITTRYQTQKQTNEEMDALLDQARTIYEGEIVHTSTPPFPVPLQLTPLVLSPLGLSWSTPGRIPHLRPPHIDRSHRFSCGFLGAGYLQDVVHRRCRNGFDFCGGCAALAVFQEESGKVVAQQDAQWRCRL